MFSYDETLHGGVGRVDATSGRSVLVYGVVTDGRADANGLLTVAGAVRDFTVARGGRLSCTGSLRVGS
jgi:hypothetical protein